MRHDESTIIISSYAAYTGLTELCNGNSRISNFLDAAIQAMFRIKSDLFGGYPYLCDKTIVPNSKLQQTYHIYFHTSNKLS